MPRDYVYGEPRRLTDDDDGRASVPDRLVRIEERLAAVADVSTTALLRLENDFASLRIRVDTLTKVMGDARVLMLVVAFTAGVITALAGTAISHIWPGVLPK